MHSHHPVRNVQEVDYQKRTPNVTVGWLTGTFGEWNHKGQGRKEFQLVDSQRSHLTEKSGVKKGY